MKRALGFLIAAAVLLGGLWFVLRPVTGPAAIAPTVEQRAGSLPAVAATPAPERPRRFELQPLAAGVATPVLAVQEGDLVELQVTSARNDELHLHGYDLSLSLRAGESGTLSFRAEHAGRFDLELHHAHAEIAVLEVQPR